MYCTRKADVCAHGRKINGKVNTCYNKFELLLIAEKIEHVEGKKLHFKRSGSIDTLWKDISAYMKSKHKCMDELCWVETLRLKNVEKKAFKPKLPEEWLVCDPKQAPENNCMNIWLSNYEIDDVLQQFEDNVENFEYLGSVPIDFAKFPEKEINGFSVEKSLKKGKTKVGMVFNTDPSTKGGQHWICAFIDLETSEIDFFDSYGSNGVYPKEIDQLFTKVKKEAKEIGVELVVKKNKVRHQYKNSECGVYCMKFIADRLNKSFESVVKVPIPDNVVNQERWTRFFRTDVCRY
jgi:hypothetical protein